jgi:hypothetical protein
MRNIVKHKINSMMEISSKCFKSTKADATSSNKGSWEKPYGRSRFWAVPWKLRIFVEGWYIWGNPEDILGMGAGENLMVYVAQWYSTCLVFIRSWVQSQALNKQSTKKGRVRVEGYSKLRMWRGQKVGWGPGWRYIHVVRCSGLPSIGDKESVRTWSIGDLLTLI